MAFRTDGDWESWTGFFLDCVTEAATDGVAAEQALFTLTVTDRRRLADPKSATVPAMQLFESLPGRPVITLATAIQSLGVSKPTATNAIDALQKANILREETEKRRDRVYSYHAYLHVLTKDTE